MKPHRILQEFRMTAVFRTRKKAVEFARRILEQGGRVLGPLRHPEFAWVVSYSW